MTKIQISFTFYHKVRAWLMLILGSVCLCYSFYLISLFYQNSFQLYYFYPSVFVYNTSTEKMTLWIVFQCIVLYCSIAWITQSVMTLKGQIIHIPQMFKAIKHDKSTPLPFLVPTPTPIPLLLDTLDLRPFMPPVIYLSLIHI